MKRPLGFCGILIVCGLLTGCPADPRSGLIDDVLAVLSLATQDVGNITTRVKEAVKKAKEEGTLDLSEANAATLKLKETSDELQKQKRRIETVRAQISEDDKKVNANKQREKVQAAFAELLKQRNELQDALKDAEQLPNAKTKVEELRKKITEAEAPYAALGR